MIPRTTRRILALAALAFGLSGSPILAQDEVPAEGATSSGDPLYGYVGTAFIAAGGLFVLCKSARR